MQVSLGGATPRAACTTWGENGGNAINPSGVFFNGQMPKGTHPFAKVAIIGSLFKRLEASIDGYMLAQEGASFKSVTIVSMTKEGLGDVVKTLQQIQETLNQAIGASDDGAIRSAAARLQRVLSCAGPGTTMCWAANPLFTEAARILQGILDLVDAGARGERLLSAVVMKTRFESATKAIRAGQSKLDTETQLYTELTDLSAGFGLRATVNMDVPMIGMVGGRAEITYSTADAFKQCDKFSFIYEDVFASALKGTSPVVAKTQVVSASGGIASQSVASASAAFDGKLATTWNLAGNVGSTSTTFGGNKAGVVIRTWSIDTVQSIHVYSNGSGSGPAQISLSVLDESGGEERWEPVSLGEDGLLPAAKGWHVVPLDAERTVPQQTLWRVIVEKQNIAGDGVVDVPSTDGRCV